MMGRADDCDVKLVSRAMSRQHCYVRCDDRGRWLLRDAQSINGTTLNGKHDCGRALQARDEIRLADVIIIVEEVLEA